MKHIKIKSQISKYNIILITMLFLLIPVKALSLDVTANSLSIKDIQAAIDQVSAAGGGTVYLPAGTSEWLTDGIWVHGGINLIGQGSSQTILRWNFPGYRGVVYNESSRHNVNKPFRVSGIGFYGVYGANIIQTLLDIQYGQGFRIDNCIFEGGVYIVNVSNLVNLNSRGVIDHCTIRKGPAGTIYGYGVTANARVYSDVTLGAADAIFIEDCTIEDMSHPVGSFGGAHYVLRYSTINDTVAGGGTDAHGPGYVYFNGATRGTAAWEIYNNIFTHNPSWTTLNWCAMRLRAGKGVIFNNIINNNRHMVNFVSDPYTCTNGGLDHINGVYIWGNTLNNVTEEPVFIEDTDCTRSYVRFDQEVFLNQLSGYTPYTYPHPLVSGGSSPTSPASPTNFRFK